MLPLRDPLAGLPRHKQYARIATFALFVLLVLGGLIGDCSRGATQPADLPDDPFQRCAVKALRGDFGQLAEWQRVGYARGLDIGATRKRAWVTTYFPEEGHHRGDETASGYGCSERVASANLIPRRSFVWTQATGLRQVLDRGASSNDDRARRKPYYAELWIDFWEPSERLLFGDENGGAQTVWIVERRP